MPTLRLFLLYTSICCGVVSAAKPLHAVPLLLKPAEPTGRITLAAEGLAVLRTQKGPFGILTAVGPTRTGKSTILGRAFLRGRHENAFEIGGGVLSHTTGAHISSRPVMLNPPGGGDPIPFFLVDTEGFSGIGGRTSKTYEANLFGLACMMSSVLVFNTAFPVDASTVAMLNRFASHAVAVLKELNMHQTVVSRRPPTLLWVVQNFNEYNLRNSKMTIEQLHDALSATHTDAAADDAPNAAAQLLGASGKGVRRGLLSSLFVTQHLHPVRRPHDSDEVVANLHQHASSELRADYLSDASKLRTLAAKVAMPAHVCAHNETATAARECAVTPLDGAAFVDLLERWVSLGHITVDEGDGAKAAVNATALIESYAAHFDVFMRWRCGEVRALLDKMARKLKGKGCPVVGCPRISSKINEKLQLLAKASISHMVDRKEFWTLPGKIATLTERLSTTQSQSCLDGLLTSARQHGLNVTFTLTPADVSTATAAAAAATAEVDAAVSRAVAARAASKPPPPPPPAVSGKDGGGTAAAPGGSITPAADAQVLQAAVDEAVDKAAAGLKEHARAVATRMQRSSARKAKGKRGGGAQRVAAIAKRAVAQALASEAGKSRDAPDADGDARRPDDAAGNPVDTKQGKKKQGKMKKRGKKGGAGGRGNRRRLRAAAAADTAAGVAAGAAAGE